MLVLRTLLISLALLLVGSVTLSMATDRFQALTTETARRLAVHQHPIAIPATELETQSGERINFVDLRGKWLLVDFIYTRCLTYCRALGTEFAQLQDLLSNPIAQDKVQMLSISFDPRHDTPKELTAYLQRSGERHRAPGWLASRPLTSIGLEQLKRSFGITVVPDAMAGGYTHNVAIHLVNPHGQLVEIFDQGDPESIGKEVLHRLGP